MGKALLEIKKLKKLKTKKSLLLGQIHYIACTLPLLPATQNPAINITDFSQLQKISAHSILDL
jgi:hypothetical protein